MRLLSAFLFYICAVAAQATVPVPGAPDWTAGNYGFGSFGGANFICVLATNATAANSYLRLIGSANSASCTNYGGSSPLNSTYNGAFTFTAAFSFQYGTIESRILMTQGSGSWPAFWMLGTNCLAFYASPPATCNYWNTGSTEIDVAEILSSNETSVNQQLHTNAGTGKQCSATATNVGLNWHIYSLVWTSTSLVWKIDGITTCTASSPTNYIPSEPMFVLFDEILGGCCGGTVTPGAFPQTMIVDYVRVTDPNGNVLLLDQFKPPSLSGTVSVEGSANIQ